MARNTYLIGEARGLADEIRTLLDRTTPGHWVGVHGRDRARDRQDGHPGAIESELSSSKRTICDGIGGGDKAFVLHLRRNIGRVADLLEKMAAVLEEDGAPAAPAVAAVAPPEAAAAHAAVAAPPAQASLHPLTVNDADVELDLSTLDGLDMAEIEETLKTLGG